MPIELHLRTGNLAPQPVFIEWRFIKTDDRPIELHFDGRQATLEVSEWPAFVNVVRQRSPASWRTSRPIPALAGNEAARDLLRGCQGTQSFQILLAAVDIIQAFRMTENRPVDELLRDFEDRNHTVRSVFGPTGIYLVPPPLLQDADEATINALLMHNKLCQADLAAAYQATRYYIPYAVPSTERHEMPPEANEFWNKIRTEYYAFRHPLPATVSSPDAQYH